MHVNVFLPKCRKYTIFEIIHFLHGIRVRMSKWSLSFIWIQVVNLHCATNLREYSSSMRGFAWNLCEFDGAAADFMSKIAFDIEWPFKKQWAWWLGIRPQHPPTPWSGHRCRCCCCRRRRPCHRCFFIVWWWRWCWHHQHHHHHYHHFTIHRLLCLLFLVVVVGRWVCGFVGWLVGWQLFGCSLFFAVSSLLFFYWLWPFPAHPFSCLCDFSICSGPRNLKRVAKELGERMTDEELQVVVDGGTGYGKWHVVGTEVVSWIVSW